MRMLFLTALIGAVGCQEYEIKSTPPPTDEGDTDVAVEDMDPEPEPEPEPEPDPTHPDQVTDTHVVPAEAPLDILFALDKSGSMTEETRNLGRAFDDFISEINNVTSGWQIGVSVKDNGCFNEGVITAQTPNYEDVFDDAVSGLNLFGNDLEEQLLELAAEALSKTDPGECNRQFLRPGAVVHMILISDEPEQSGQSWQHWLNDYYSYVQSTSQIVVSAVIDQNDDCGTLGTGYIEIANQTGGTLLDVCDSDWGMFASQLGSVTAGLLKTFSLSGVPDVDSIIVLVDGVPYPSWTYDPLRNVIEFDDIFPAGTVVEILWLPEVP